MTNLQTYSNACNALAKEFSGKYCDDTEVDWVADRIGEIANIGDVFLDMSSIAMVVREQPTVDRFWEAYWESIEKDCKTNLYNLVRYGVKQMRKITNKEA